MKSHQGDLFDNIVDTFREVQTSPTREPIVDPSPEYIEPAGENNPLKEDLRRKTEEWIANNPSIYLLFEKFAREMVSIGKKFGVKLLAERVRWECHVTHSIDDTGFKVSNNYTAYIARRLAQDIPGLEELIVFRQTRY